MTVDSFNRLPEHQVRARLTDCCAAARWVDLMLARRPFRDAGDVARAARDAWMQMSTRDWLEAFAAHPRIGDIDSLREKYASTREMAGGEQAAVGGADVDTLREIGRLNREYENRFGFIFIVFASGKSAVEMLELLKARIDNTRDQELRNAAAEQLKITLLRLDRLVT
ncbi:MAG: 2-oxo-4-hydroxy-4-carboxy-5-ureidoimidazoline decarboxylase [Proteobacteria bacterium]|nr:MAG: 2-oxo-4-hydroxy-4-carboxy-5-ureidoimidazoline decarboxylase [Pseudomonadota bacterium]